MDGGTNRATVESVEARRGYGDFSRGTNVGDKERIISVVAGAALALFGLRRFSMTGLSLAAMGGSLVYRGITGHCSMYQRLGMNTAEESRHDLRGNLGVKIERSIVVAAPTDKVSRF